MIFDNGALDTSAAGATCVMLAWQFGQGREGMPQSGRSLEDATLDAELSWGEANTADPSGFDTALGDLAAAERRAEAERRMRHRAASDFLAAFYRSDVENAKALKDQGVLTGFSNGQIAFAKARRPAEVAIVVTSNGNLSVLYAPGGKRALVQRTDVGEFDPLIKTALRKQMIRLVIGYLGIGH